jgi:hypothetical protein
LTRKYKISNTKAENNKKTYLCRILISESLSCPNMKEQSAVFLYFKITAVPDEIVEILIISSIASCLAIVLAKYALLMSSGL